MTEQLKDELIRAVDGAAKRVVALARTIRDGSTPVPNSEWSARDLLAHVVRGAELYVEYLDGGRDPAADLSDMAGGSLRRSNQALLAAEDERDVLVLGDRLEAAMQRCVALFAPLDLDEVVQWHDRKEPVRSMLAISLGEMLIHGYDLAAALHAPWTISRYEATLIGTNLRPILPLLVDKAKAQDLTATVDVRLRGDGHVVFVFDHGDLTVTDHVEDRADVVISAEPVAFLLVAYGRKSQWPAIATGKMLAWGRKPWIALRLTSYLTRP